MKLQLAMSCFRNILLPSTPSPAASSTKIPKKIKEDIARLISARTVLSNDCLPSNDIYAGDIFLINGQYYINIRPTCDSLRREELYLLQGIIKENPDSKSKWKGYKETKEHTNYLVMCCHNNKHIQFQFKEIFIKKREDILSFRIGRLLHPYITDLQRHFANYISRPGVYRTLEFDMLYEEISENGK